MKQLKFDTGVVSYKIGHGVVRMNPSDPNLYLRFQQALEKFTQLQTTVEAAAEPADVLQAMAGADATMKQTLNWVFGPGNDFDAVCGGVNLLSADPAGRQLISKLLSALEPVLVQGAKQCAQSQVAAAQAQAQQRRSQQ